MIISERIFYVMEQKNITQLELSRRTGIATSNISDWKKEKTNPKADCLISICDALEITADQLLTGKGIDPECKDADMDYQVTRSDIKILKQIHSLDDTQYKRLMAYVKCFVRSAVNKWRVEWKIVNQLGTSNLDLAGRK
ncbi:MAG: helix-turn-helix domain-containing protein [Lachnospira sp.]